VTSTGTGPHGMPSTDIPDWRERAARLREELVATGKLWTPAWRAAVTDVPRHHFVPFFFERHPGAGWSLTSADDQETRQRWLDAVYANRSLVTRLGVVPDGGRDRTGPTSSASAPSLVTRMLEALDVRDGHRVLEIGTGTGYNAALLCHRLGDHGVHSVDIDPELVADARDRLAKLGYWPTLAHGDGAAGLPGHGHYDRIIATCAVTRVPWAWAEQTHDGGVVLVDVKAHATVGNLALLHRLPDRLEGTFDAGTATFMQMRSSMPATSAARSAVPRDRSAARTRRAVQPDQRLWENPPLWFQIHVREPGRIEFGFTQDPVTGDPADEFYTARDGSWCELATASDGGSRYVHEGGPRSLWTSMEDTIGQWQDLGEPGWERLGLTVLSDSRQIVWVDHPDSEHRWTLPSGS